MAKLTAKQQKFVQEYLIDLNATQAAIRAGYSEKTAEVIGHENLRKPNIANEIQKAMDERAKRTEITADRVLQEYAKIGFADMRQFLSYRTERAIVGHEEGNPIFGYQDIIELKPSDEVDGSVIAEVKQTREGIAFKLHDKKGALDSIARHLGMFTDKVEHSGTVTNKVDLSTLTADDLTKMESILKKTQS